MVHNTQKHYRELVNLFSRPGEIRISTFDTSNFTGFSDAVLATVLTLFDNEIAFYANNKKDCDELQTLTGGQCHGDLAEIDYAVVKADELTEVLFENVKAGTLASPEKSATLIIEVVSIGEGHRYALKGPGIKAENILEMTLDPKWMKMRTERCKEFPLGINLILIDLHNQMTVTPRTILAEVM